MKRRGESHAMDLFANTDCVGTTAMPMSSPLVEETKDWLSAGEYSDFGDFANIMQVLEHVWLGNGERARKLLEVRGEPLGKSANVEIGAAGLEFEDVRLEKHL